ncbi:MAG: GFA family protein [Vitreimonas sp.]
MTDWKLPWSASCMCGRVQMRITQGPLISMACHCRGCQRLTSGPYSLTLMLPKSGFSVEGQTEIGALHKPEMQHHFCAHCKNWVYSDGEPIPGLVNFRSTMLDDASWVIPFVESNVAEKLSGVVSGAKHSYAEFLPPEDRQMLMEGFAREGARPR